MENRKIILLIAAVFALACLPFVILYTSGEANAALGRGFQSLLQPGLPLLLIACVGLITPWIGREAPVMLPLAFLLIYAIASLIRLDAAVYPFASWFVLGAMLLYTVTLLQVDTRRYVMAIALSSSIAFHLGLLSQATLPEGFDPLYYLLGQFLALTLILAASVCFALAAGEPLTSRVSPMFPAGNRFMVSLRSWLL